jgi:predicted TIM-barrel fold metal-dependent hydrolase
MRLEDVIRVNHLDQRIWTEELDGFVPPRVYDFHTHITHGRFDLGGPGGIASLGGAWALTGEGSTMEMLDAADALLMPGRSVERLAFPFPHRQCDFDGSNQYVAREAARRPASAALMLVHPGMTAETVEGAIRHHRFVGFKPYRWYSVTGDARNCRIPEYMPEHLLAVGNRYGLIVGLHLSKQDAIADEENLADLERLAGKFPRLRWCLFHCARSYSYWPMEKAAPRLKQIPNVWSDSSSVCETDAFDALFETLPPSRVCYGSDDLAVGVTRGKYVAYGRAWVSVDEKNQSFNTDHCDGRMTFTRYEMLRAMRRAARHARWDKAQLDNLFHGNAARLIEETRRDLNAALGG